MKALLAEHAGRRAVAHGDDPASEAVAQVLGRELIEYVRARIAHYKAPLCRLYRQPAPDTHGQVLKRELEKNYQPAGA